VPLCLCGEFLLSDRGQNEALPFALSLSKGGLRLAATIAPRYDRARSPFPLADRVVEHLNRLAHADHSLARLGSVPLRLRTTLPRRAPLDVEAPNVCPPVVLLRTERGLGRAGRSHVRRRPDDSVLHQVLREASRAGNQYCEERQCPCASLSIGIANAVQRGIGVGDRVGVLVGHGAGVQTL